MNKTGSERSSAKQVASSEFSHPITVTNVIMAVWQFAGNPSLTVPLLVSYILYNRIWPSLLQVFCMVCMVVVIVGGGMSVCLHRFFAHQAFKTSPQFAFVLGVLGTLANQGPVLWWASKHNRHHKFCDQPQDPHSWLQTSYMYAWIWWTVCEYKTDWQFVPRVYRNHNGLLFLNLMQPAIVWAWIIFLFNHVGAGWTIWAYWVPSLISTLGSLDFNLQFHPKDNKSSEHRYDDDGKITVAKGKNCKATDDPTRGDEPWIPKLIGEASHMDHHIHPRKSKRPGVDIPYKGMVAPLAYFGLIWELQY
jgi:hypothetical protein